MTRIKERTPGQDSPLSCPELPSAHFSRQRALSSDQAPLSWKTGVWGPRPSGVLLTTGSAPASRLALSGPCRLILLLAADSACGHFSLFQLISFLLESNELVELVLYPEAWGPPRATGDKLSLVSNAGSLPTLGDLKQVASLKDDCYRPALLTLSLKLPWHPSWLGPCCFMALSKRPALGGTLIPEAPRGRRWG